MSEIAQIKARFQREHRPEAEIILSSLFPSSDRPELLDPSFAFPQNSRYSFPTISRLYTYAQTCAGNTEAKLDDPWVKKSWLWLQFKCGALRSLPGEFFESAPFTSVLGGSFAFLATQAGDRLAVDREWVQSHLHNFHVTELPLLERFSLAMDTPRMVLASLSQNALKAVTDGDELILGDRYVLLRKLPTTINGESSTLLGRTNTFLAFKRQVWDLDLAKSHYKAEPTRGDQLCALRDGQVCWQVGSDQIFSAIQTKTLVLFLFAVLLTALCAWIAIRKFMEQKNEEERKRFALQTLTHELRTPLASLVVSSEEVLDCFDSVPGELQGTMVRMCDDIQRLHRLAEVSKTYLSSERGETGLIHFNIQKVPSIQGYLSSVLEPFENRLDVTMLSADGAFSLDTHWVSVCIKNLVENALQHGAPPVRFKSELRDRVLEITVEDAGSSLSLSLDAMTEPFQKGTSSSGLGLGLAIVKRVAEAMKAELSLARKPTQFKLRIYEGRELR